MSAEHHRRLTAEFLHAAELEPRDRRAFLEKLRRREARLCAEVESLLRHEADVPPALRSGPIDLRRIELLSTPDRVGPYRLVERIGEGGMGVVYRAEQTDPIRREVAVKLIRAGLETEHVLARFDAERRVLALLEHPNIARVLDAGTTEAGRPYVVIEYVRGEPITDFCDRRTLGLDERLRLFLDVCDAMHYAHQNAILHRDLKPSNILVVHVDGRPVPKIIDFGIAKALSPDGGVGTTLTEAGQLVGTPAYMSPEQAAGHGSTPDIRSDVYSLGAILYQLLVGTPPLDLTDGASSGVDAIRRVIREREPTRPSRAAGAGERTTEAAERRGTDPTGLARRLGGDLDAITQKALEKERTRRYGSAAELAADVRRHLLHEPVLARPPATLYRLGKLARKHRTWTAIAATLVPVLLGSALLLALQARRVARERDRAEEVSELLVHSYNHSFFDLGGYTRPDAADVFRRTARRFEIELADRPILQARMLQAAGNALRGVDDRGAALPILERARARLREQLGPNHPLTLTATNDVARLYSELSRAAEAEALFRRVLDARRRTLGEGHRDTVTTMNDLAHLLREFGRKNEAATWFERSLSTLSRVAGVNDRETLTTAGLLAAVYLDLGLVDEADQLLREIVPRMGNDWPEKSRALYNLACIEALRGNTEAALERLRRVVDRGFRLGFFADGNLRSLFADPRFLGIVWRTRGHDRGPRNRVLARAAREVGPGGDAAVLFRYLRGTLSQLDSEWLLAQMYDREGRYAEARPLVERRLARLREEYGENGVWVGITLWHLAQVHLGEGDTSLALATLDDTIRILDGRRKLDAKSWALYARARRAALLGQRRNALRHLSEAVEAGLIEVDLVRRDLALLSLAATPEYRAAIETMARRDAPPIVGDAEVADVANSRTWIAASE